MTDMKTHYEGDDCPGGHVVAIPIEKAKKIAAVLRGQESTTGWEEWEELADFLDPPEISLLNEVADVITSRAGYGDKDDTWNKELAASIMTVVRNRVFAIKKVLYTNITKDLIYRDDVIRLLGGGDE